MLQGLDLHDDDPVPDADVTNPIKKKKKKKKKKASAAASGQENNDTSNGERVTKIFLGKC